ncbi:MAG: beta-ketoacyl-[acyl-carrier-protein] synthase family protein [Verrucomicrobia bacterium]|jgi:3-oxoacyl-(acyl-carrier-protein) synthase|nr:beta-ketoacyl-[acyl-carrier-protein] synthase family protein [Verrucomicrobiota bacterium]
MGLFSDQRAVVTGIGVVAPNAVGKVAFWDSLLAGHSGTKRITLFDPSSYRSQIAGEVANFDLRDYLKPKGRVSRMSRQTQLALAAAVLAEADVGISAKTLAGFGPVPIYLGVSSSAIEIVEKGIERMARRGAARVPTSVVEASSPQQAASTIGEELGFPTTVHTIASACAAGLEATGIATDSILGGKADLVITGGADAPITKLSFACFDRAGLASARNDDPARASRPFDRDCDSGVISEGAGILFIENYEQAVARGANIYMEILGYASHADPGLDRPMLGLQDSMEIALANAHKRPVDIDYICAHGPSHPVIDRAETDMIKAVFGADAYRVPVTSVKGNIGNPLAAAGPIQLASCALALQSGIIPPIANHENPAEGCDLDYVSGTGRTTHPRTALINAHGLGGGNTSLVVQRIDA